MNKQSKISPAPLRHSPERPLRGVAVNTLQAIDGGSVAGYSLAAGPVPLSGSAATSGVKLGTEPHGPPTTSRMDGAGGAFNSWDCKIAKALARGDEKAARELQQARADINIKLLQTLEPVWIPTESQLAIGMMMRVAEVEGVCTLDAEPVGSIDTRIPPLPSGWSRVEL